MSTGGGQTKPTELLVALGINDEISKKNINTYIQRLKNIPNLTINLDVKGHNTQIFIEYEKQIKALERQLEASNQKLKNIGNGASPPLPFFDEFKQQVTHSVKSIATLNKTFGDLKINVNAFYKQLAKVPTGDLQSLEKILTQLKTEMQTVNTNEFKLNGIQETQQNLQALEANLNNIYELQKAYADTADFEQLTSKIVELNTQITNIQLGEGLNITGISDIPNQLEKINQGIIEFGNNTKVAAQDSTNLLTSFIDGAKRAFELTEFIKKKREEIKPPKIDEDSSSIEKTSNYDSTNVSSKKNKKRRNKVNNTKTSEKATAKIAEEASSKIGGGLAAIGGLATIGRGLLASTGIGAALVLAEFGINKLQESRAKAKQMAEELKAEQKNIVDSYIANAPDIDSLTSRYGELEKSIALGNTDSSILTEYQEISNQLGEILPHIVAREDEFGNKIIGSSEALKVKIELLKEQQAIESQIAEQAAKEKRDEDIKIRKKSISDLMNEYDSKISGAAISLTQNAQTPLTTESVKFYDDHLKPSLKKPEDFDNKIKEIKKLQSDAEISGNNYLADHYKNLSDAVKHHKKEIIETEKEINLSVLAQKDDYISNIADVISENERLTDSIKNNAEGFAAQLIAAVDASDVDTLQKSLTSLFSNEDATTLINDVIGSFQNMENSTSETFDSMAAQTKDRIGNISEDLSKLGLSEKEVSSITDSLKQRFKETTQTQKELSIEMKVNNLTFAEAKEKVFGYKDEVEKLTTSYEQLAGVSQKKISDTSDLLLQYESLTNQLKGYNEEEIRNLSQKGNLTAEEQRLIDLLNSKQLIMSSLNTIYPILLDKDGKAITLSEEKINAIQAENHANETLLKAYQLARDGKLTVEQQMTVDAAKAAKDRIEIRRSEIQSLMAVNLGLQEVIDNQNKGSKMTDGEGLGAMRASMIQAANNAKIEDKTKELNTFQKQLDSNISSIDKFISSNRSSQNATNKANKAAKEANKTTKDSIYITDKYKQSLDNLNLEIEKQVKIQSSLPKHSNEYRKSLQNQLNLEREKLNLLEKQEKSIKSQIASGKINKTGTVSNTSTTTTTQKLSGWSGRISSNFGYRNLNGNSDNHRGIDIAMQRGTKVDANISGKVIASGLAGKDNDYHSSYGNIVVIQDENNLKHIYAHLDKAVAKLGSTIDVGQQVGTVGSTGKSTGPHLHYEINKNGNIPINPTDYINNARSGIVSSTGITAVETTQQAIDQAKSELVSMQRDILNQKELISKIEKDIIDSQLSYYDWKRTNIQSNLDYEDAKIKLVDKSSNRYSKTIDLQTKYLEQKQAVNNQELEYIEGLIKKGSLSANTLDEMKSRLLELKTEMLDTNNAISQLALNKLETFNYQRSLPESQLEYENVKIKELDTNSARYAKTLQLMTTYMNQKQNVNRSELNYLQQQIASGKHSGEVLEKLKERYSQLTTEMKSLDIEIREKNYEIILNIKTHYDEKNDAIQYQIDRSKIIQSMYKEGSADATREINFQMRQTQILIDNVAASIARIQQEMLHLDINSKDYKDLNAQLQDMSRNWWNLKANLKSYNDELKDTNDKVEEELANKLFNAYKEYMQEKRDAHIKSIDEEIKQENERHDKVIDNYKDEMDLFRKNVQDKLKLIDRQEAQRDYNQDISKLEKERGDVQGQYNLLLLDNSHEAKAKRKKLQEQLQQIDEEISEKRRDREIELRKESLNDQLEAKETEISKKEELENEYHEKELNLLDEKKQYWEQYYTDRLNDERKLQEFKDKIRNKEFESLKQEFEEHKAWLKESMPELEKTLTDSMDVVGTSIRQNIIDELEHALKLMEEFGKAQNENGEYGSSKNNPTNGDSSSSLSLGDKQVLLAKYMTDVLTKDESPGRQASIREKAHALAAEGRKNNSSITANTSFDNYINTLTQDQKQELANYFKSSANTVVDSKYLQDYITDYGNILSGSGTHYTEEKSKTINQGDKEILLGKYFTEELVTQESLPSRQSLIREKGHQLANKGRNQNNGTIPSALSFRAALNNFSKEALEDFANFVETNISQFIETPYLRSAAKRMAAQLKNSASAFQGGMTSYSSNGIDGFGGKAMIVHPNELINSPIDTNNLLSMANIMERAGLFFRPLLDQLPSFSNTLGTVQTASASTYGDINIEFNIDKMNGDMNDLTRFSKMINADLLRKRGMRN
ncbi:peptidoglycan DD-metalloendopeptidase family protein [Lysinibacillus sp. CNPSo 3705]|uniref:peptidoglycan DD-metalloendopeptidase family protein n=1 Tax=Lysinibacillus sp. CNPSo 3705 TaxID=3028148 RepID=UPI002363EDA4|nr:peptidoglycan DD-metalloendopeptidase family protein [Lysinibacillus sp. CNPSo 3705]MDD1502581.1 peptidoglycan DD-metalloendopeptidase family protein [Lysinibacillus sp. CNPSo 3705]